MRWSGQGNVKTAMLTISISAGAEDASGHGHGEAVERLPGKGASIDGQEKEGRQLRNSLRETLNFHSSRFFFRSLLPRNGAS
jgi:hypothetical protein